MKRLLLAFLAIIAFPLLVSAQGFRFDATITQQGTVAGVTNVVVIPASAQVAFCNFPANATPCTNKATTYTSQTLVTPCSTSTQIVLTGTTSCVASPDAQENWGVWVPAGMYSYTITLPGGVNLGPYVITLFPTTGNYTVGNLTVSGTLNANSGITTPATSISTMGDITGAVQAPGSSFLINSPPWTDMTLNCNFSADCHMRVTPATTTATVNVSPGACTLSVGSTTNFNTINQGPIKINWGLADYEQITVGNWSVTDQTHIAATCANSHTQPFQVQMFGQGRLEAYAFNLFDFDFASSPLGLSLTGTASGVSREGMIIGPSTGGVYMKTGLNGNHFPRLYGLSGSGLNIFGSSAGACVGTQSPCSSGTGTSGPINFSTNETDDPNGAAAGIIIQPASKAIDFTEQASAATTPAANHVRLYSKNTTDLLYTKNGGGTEAVVPVFPTASLPVSGNIITANGANGVLQDSGINPNSFTGFFTCTNVTPVTISANVTTDQNLMACTIPAGTLNRVGRTLRIKTAGVYTTAATSVAQMTFKMRLCTVSACGSGVVITPINIQTSALASQTIASENWSVEALSTTQTAGASSAYEAHGDFLIDLSSTLPSSDSIFGDSNTATVGTIDSTAQLFLQCSMAFSTASASNTATQRQLIVETVN